MIKSDYWNKFYSKTFNLDIPSQFCSLFCNEVARGSKVIEFGCGNGRDSRVMAVYGFKVLGLDASKTAIDYCINHAGTSLGPLLTYLPNDVAAINLSSINEFIGEDKVYIYSRFFQHSISVEEQEAMFKSISTIRGSVVSAYFEFRNANDEKSRKVFGEDHYRRYQTAEFFKDVLHRNGFSVSYEISGRGYAKYFEEDPDVTRIIAAPI